MADDSNNSKPTMLPRQHSLRPSSAAAGGTPGELPQHQPQGRPGLLRCLSLPLGVSSSKEDQLPPSPPFGSRLLHRQASFGGTESGSAHARGGYPRGVAAAQASFRRQASLRLLGEESHPPQAEPEQLEQQQEAPRSERLLGLEQGDEGSRPREQQGERPMLEQAGFETGPPPAPAAPGPPPPMAKRSWAADDDESSSQFPVSSASSAAAPNQLNLQLCLSEASEELPPAPSPRLASIRHELQLAPSEAAPHALFRPADPFVVRLGQSGASSSSAWRRREFIGGKAHPLDELIRIGVARVPPAVCVTTHAFEQAVLALGLGPHIHEVFQAGVGEPELCRQQLRVIRRALRAGGELPPEIGKELQTQFLEMQKLNHRPEQHGGRDKNIFDPINSTDDGGNPGGVFTCAVRSSGTAEDGSAHSFAGLHESVLNVPARLPEILAAVRRCWASMFGFRAFAYRRRLVPPGGPLPRMAVIVQLQLNPSSAGVLFTADPRGAESDRFVVESAWGLGEAVVSGVVTPHQYELDWTRVFDSDARLFLLAQQGQQDQQNSEVPPDDPDWTGGGLIVARQVEPQLKKYVFRRTGSSCRNGAGKAEEVEQEDPGNGANAFLRWCDTTPEERARTEGSLNVAQLFQLAALGRRVAEHYGRPYDVEWAFEGGCLWLLQARPITALTIRTPHDYSHAEFGIPSRFSSHMCAVAYARCFVHVLEAERAARLLQKAKAPHCSSESTASVQNQQLQPRRPGLPRWPEDTSQHVRSFFGRPYLLNQLWNLFGWHSWAAVAQDKNPREVAQLVLPDALRLQAELEAQLPGLTAMELRLNSLLPGAGLGDRELVQCVLRMLELQTRLDTLSYLAGCAVEFFEKLAQDLWLPIINQEAAALASQNHPDFPSRPPLDLSRLTAGINADSEASQAAKVLSEIAEWAARHPLLRDLILPGNCANSNESDNTSGDGDSIRGSSAAKSGLGLQILRRLPQASALVQAFDGFLARFFYMSDCDADVAAVRFRQAPAVPWGMLVAHVTRAVASQSDPAAAQGSSELSAQAVDAELRRLAQRQFAHAAKGALPEVTIMEPPEFLGDLAVAAGVLRVCSERSTVAVEAADDFVELTKALREFLGWKERVHVWYTVHAYFLRLGLVEAATRLLGGAEGAANWWEDGDGFHSQQQSASDDEEMSKVASSTTVVARGPQRQGACGGIPTFDSDHQFWNLEPNQVEDALRAWLRVLDAEEEIGQPQQQQECSAVSSAFQGGCATGACASDDPMRELQLGFNKLLRSESSRQLMRRNFPAPAQIWARGGAGTTTTPAWPEAGDVPQHGSVSGGPEAGLPQSILGLPCVAGVAEGRIVVLENLGQAHLLRAGDILVAELTNPSWSPLFSLVSGLLLEHGGALSHAALVAREHRIPLISGLLGAVGKHKSPQEQLFRTGDRVRMDGSTGMVTWLQKMER